MLSQLPAGHLASAPSSLLLDGRLATPELLSALEEVNAALRADYALRREVLIKRLDVTVESFLWSAKAEVRGHRFALE